MDLIVYCADIGSVAQGNFGWVRIDRRTGEIDGCAEIDRLVESVADDLRQELPTVLGFECPLWVPLPTESERLGRGRPNEGSPPWSGGPGGNALATGLVQVAWILRGLRQAAPESGRVYLNWREFAEASGAGLFLWEAFVSGKAKAPPGSGSHIGDAEVGAKAFVAALPDPILATETWKPDCEVLSLLGTALMRTGWSQNADILGEACLVVKASPQSPVA